jgi:hypothetical protein
VKRLAGTSRPLSTIRRSHWLFSMTAELRSEVAGSRIRTWHLMPTERMGPPPGALPPMRMTASWSGSNDPTAYKSVTRRCTQWRALLGSSADRQPSDAGALQKAPVAVHHRSACSGVKALRNTSPARRQAAKLCYRFGPLTPSARSANLIAGDGTRNGCLAPNKEPVTNQKHDLTGKAPYRFESGSLQRGVCCEPDALDQVSRLAAAYNRGLLASFSQWAVCQKILLGQDDGD